MLLLPLPIVPWSTDWTKKLTRCSYEGFPLYHTLFDLSADLACPCGQCAFLQDRDIHRPSGHPRSLQPTHSTRRNYIFQLSVARWWKHIGGKEKKSMCGETQTAQSRAHKHSIKANFIETAFPEHSLSTFVLRCFGGSAASARSSTPAVCLSCALSFRFSWKRNATALITALIGRYMSIPS